MVIRAISLFTASMFVSCGMLDRDKDKHTAEVVETLNDGPSETPTGVEQTTESCSQQKEKIDESINALNHCKSSSDCSYQGIHPHWGCSILYNKLEDTTEVKASIVRYSESACWDGSTALTTLSCIPMAEEDLDCIEGKCAYDP